MFLQGMKADKAPTTKAGIESESESTSAQAQSLEDELLANPPKGCVDKLHVLRSRMKRLKTKEDSTVSSLP